MKKYFRYISLTLVFTITILCKNFTIVKANALAPALVESSAKYIIGEGLIASGITIGAPIVAGVAGAVVVGSVVNDYCNAHPEVLQQVKSDISAGVTGAYNLSDSVWQSIKSYTQSKFYVGDNPYVAPNVFSDGVNSYTYSLNSNHTIGFFVNGSQVKVLGTFNSNTVITNAYLWVANGYILLHYLSVNPYAGTVEDNLSTGQSASGTNEIVKGSGATVTGDSVLSNPSYDYTNPNTKTRVLPIPGTLTSESLDLGGLITKSPADIINAPISTDIPTDTPATQDYTGVLGNILDSVKAIPGAITGFFTIDWSVVRTHMDYTPILVSHFQPFYDITNQLKNIQASPQGSSGKFYMVIPKAMGGDDQLHCVLDLTAGGVYITWARDIIKYGIWIAFLWYIFKTFQPRFNIS